MRIGLDIMGGDLPPSLFLEALSALKQPLTVFIEKPSPAVFPHLELVLCGPSISMSEEPLAAVQNKPDSSLVRGVLALASHQIDAFISLGNTGSLLAASSQFLPFMSGVKRCALMAQMPSSHRGLTVIDVGANLHCPPIRQLAFAELALAYHKNLLGHADAKVGLLNIGAESQKGDSQRRKVRDVLSLHLQEAFVGNVESKDAFFGKCDILVTDGFTGNIFLKTSEGLAELMMTSLSSLPEAASVLCHLQTKFHYERQQGALLAGLKQPVIKCHGRSGPKALAGAIDYAKWLLGHAKWSTFLTSLT